ncbi:hemagglutinin repeat-containing protein, partial [Pseudomonas lijiangensis]|uniref:hemagglutinin repeat-containing protein n=1 Tax=Pseudomonas lijiangensis TaxID=2995658 RepID=UPI001C89A2A0
GLINAAETLKITSGDLNNRAGQLLGTTALTLDSAALDTGAKGLINSQGTLTLTADSLSADTGGEVSALGTMTLVLKALSLDASRLIGNAGLSLDLNGADLDNRAGLITAKGPLTVKQVRDVNNQGGEISSAQAFTLTARTLDNSGGQLISSDLLTLNADSLLNQNGLISGWQGLDVTATSLDNRNRGTLSSRNGAVEVDLSGALLNSGNGALVSQTALTVTADSLDNRGGILSSGTGQTLTVTGLLNNSQSGLIDSGADLTLTANALDNSAGTLISTGKATLDLIGALTNTGGKLASGGDWLLKRSSAVHNQGGQLISQRLMTLTTGLLDNSTTGTVAANGTLLITATGKVLNHTDGLIYSQNAGVELDATSLDNTRGAVQAQSTLKVEVGEGVDNLNGRLIAQNGDLTVEAASLDNRGGLLSSLKGLFTAQISGVLKNGYDLAANRQGGVIQAQRLSLTALGGFDNYGGRVSASTGEALLTTANLDNRNGGIYAKGLVRVIAKDLDNSGDNDGQIAGGQVDLRLTGDLNTRLGIIESDSTLAIKAASLDNQTGQIRSLGTLDAADFQIGTLFDNRRGTVEVANSNLILNAASFLNANGSLLHAGAGTFGLSTANLMQAGGNLVTRGGLTVTADSWTNSSVIQAGRLTVNVGTFNQTASGQLLASSAFVGTGGSWTNEGVIASDGTLSLNLTGGYGGGGRTSSLGTLGLTASQLALTSTASLTGGARTELNITGLASNYGRITSAADLIVNAGSVTNYGTLGATQNLTFNTASLLNSQGLIFSGGDMQANVGSLSNLKGDFYALNNLTIKGYGAERANQVSNISGSMESGGNFAISATAFENRTEGSDGQQASTAGRTLVKGVMAINCLDCGRGFLVDHVVREYFEGGQDTDVTASALLASGQNFTFDGGGFLNSKSTIRAAGNIVINADSFKNVGSIGGVVERTRIYRSSDWYTVEYAKGYNERNNPDYPNVYYVDGGGELRLGIVVGDILDAGSDTTYQYISYRIIDAVTSAPVNSVPYMYYPDTNDINRGMPSLYDRSDLVDIPDVIKSLELISDVEKIVDGGSAARSAVIQSGGSVSITATQNLQNSVIRQDYTAAGGTSKVQGTSPSGTSTAIIRVNAQLPPDLSQQQVNPLTLPGFSLPTGQNGLFRLSAQTGSNAAATQTSTAPQNWTLGSASVSVAQREQTVSDTQSRALQFGTVGQVSTTTRQLADVVRQNSGLSANASAFDSSAPVDSVSNLKLTGHSADLTGVTQVANVQALPGSSNATSQVARVQGLPGSTTPSNPHKYLIETNPVLTDLRQFMSSDYLLAGLGYDPEASAKRLGDGLYEQRLVQQAIVARTGQAFLAGQTSNEAQLKYLMNNAIASKEQLNLAIGVTLSPPQVAALTHDIVWLEEHEVNGEKVLVPVLYLAQANNRLGPTGALIAGNDVTLIAGDELDNVGTLHATNNLSATAGTNLVNVGLIEAGNRLDLLAGNDLINKAGGILYGRDVTLTATRGDVINERTVTRAVGATGYQDFADSAARIESASDLTVKAGRDVMNIGGTLQAGRDLSLIAGRDVNIGAAQTETARAQGANTQSSITQIGSNISAGRDLIAQSGRDISIIASNIDAKRDIAMAATENLTLSSAADEQHSSSKAKKSTSQQDRIDQVSASMNAGGNVALSAGNSMAIIASHIQGGGDLDIDAAQNLTITSAADEQHSYSKTKKVTSQQDRITQVSSTLSAGGNVALGSGKDMEIIASHVRGGGDVDIDAAQDLTITSAMDESASFYSKKSKGSFGRGSSKQQESYDSTNVASIIEAGGDLTVNTSKSVDDGIVLEGGHNVTVIGSQLRAGEDLLVGATNDVAVLSGVEEHGSYSKKTKSGFLGLSKSGKSQLTTTASQVASELEADNDVVIAAGNDVRLRASETSAGNDVELRAGLVNDSGDINLVSANDTAYSRSEEYKKKTGLSVSGGFLSISSAKEAGREAQSSTSVGSNVSADRDATLQTTRDINVLGSGISAGRTVSLNAGRDVNIAAAQNESAEQQWSKNKQVGLGVAGNDNGVSLFIGADSLQEKARFEQQTAAASQVSAGQDLVINAKRDINQIGSDLNASNDIDLTAGRNINIDAAREAQLVEQQRETERSGLGVSLNHNYGKTKDAVNGAGQGDDAVSQGSSTLKGIDAIGQFLAGPTADVKLGNSKQSTSQEIIEQTSRSSTLNAGNDVNMTAGNDVTVKGAQLQAGRDINIKGRDITLDVAKDSISQESSQSESWGGIHGGTSGGFKLGIGGSYGVASEDGTYGSSTATQAAAGRDINLDASNDINLVGTQVTAGRDIDLNAGNDLNIRSAQNESNSESDRHSGGGEVGLTFGSQGVGVYASVSMGKGNLDRESARQQDANLNAGNQLGFTSGNDTNVAGATLRGDEVVGRVGGDLNVSSVTDTGKVEGKEFDINATVTIGPGAGVSGSVGYGATNGSTNWVGQQTSITGKDKVDIRTENHTQLDGALIASDSGNLKLDTGTLGFSDIVGKDKEHGYYLNVGGTYNPSGSAAQDSSQEGKGEKSKNGWSVEGWNYEKDREQIVRATVGAGEVVVRNDAETGSDSTAGLNRDVSKAYEITKDEESRTDLYVSKSSLEAVSNPKATLQQWQKNISLYGENSKEAVGKLIDLLVLMALLPQEAVSGRGVETAEVFVFARENERQLSSQDAGKRADRVRLLLNAVTQGEAGPDSEALVSRLSALAAEDPAKAMRAIGLLASLNEGSSGVSNFVPIAALGAGAIAALGGALAITATTPESQERMKEAANAVVSAVAKSGQTAQIQTSMSIEIWKFLFNTTFPVHLLDAENSRLVNPIVEAQAPNPASGGYAAGSPITTPISTGGSPAVDQAANDYSNPIAELPAPGVMNQEDGAKDAGDAKNLASSNGRLTAQEISNGHAFEKHVVQQGEYKDLGITTREQFALHIESIVNNPSLFRELSGGRTAYWDSASGTVVIKNPKAIDGGTAFRPVNRQAYFDGLR